MMKIDELKLSEIACRLISLTAVLKDYCHYYDEDCKAIAQLVDFTEILDETANSLFDCM